MQKKNVKKKRLLNGCSCGEKFAHLAGICLGKELSQQVRDFLLFFPTNRENFYHVKEEKFSCYTRKFSLFPHVSRKSLSIYTPKKKKLFYCECAISQ